MAPPGSRYLLDDIAVVHMRGGGTALEPAATFSNPAALASGGTFGDLQWTGIAVNNGAFKQALTPNESSIERAFCGQNREGMADVFEQAAIYRTFSSLA